MIPCFYKIQAASSEPEQWTSTICFSQLYPQFIINPNKGHFYSQLGEITIFLLDQPFFESCVFLRLCDMYFVR